MKDQLQKIQEEKDRISEEIEILSKIKKEKFGNIDISEPMSDEEKEITKKIASLFSKINVLVMQKRKLIRGK